MCFDFGGTLFDFIPLHVHGFVGALGLDGGSSASRIVERTVRLALARGVDSFEMIRLIAEELGMPPTTDLDAAVVRKRSLVEGYLKTAELDREVSTFLTQVLSACSVAVISLGLVASMETVLNRSLGGMARRIAVYGRHSLTERLDKSQLLRQAIEDAGVQPQFVLYIGDAEVDQRIGLELGIAVLRLRPFSS